MTDQFLYESWLSRMSPVINARLLQFSGLKTPREDLFQESALELWRQLDKVMQHPNPEALFSKMLRYRLSKILRAEHKAGMWLESQSGSIEYGSSVDFLHDPYLEELRKKEYEQTRKWREAHPERYRELQRRWYHEHKAELKGKKRYYEENREKLLAYQRTRYAAVHEDVKPRHELGQKLSEQEKLERKRQYNREYAKAHREQINAAARARYAKTHENVEPRTKLNLSTQEKIERRRQQQKEYREAHKEELRRYYQEYRKTHKEQLNQYRRDYDRARYAAKKQQQAS